MSSLEEKRESGSVLMVIGWVLMAFAFLVMFFYPAAVKLGETRFGIIAACLGVTGLVMSVVGVGIRRRNR